MMSASVDGYVTDQPVVKDGKYGRYTELTLRVATAGKEVHYATSRFYGRKIGPIEEYINNGDYITMSGCVTSIKEKIKSDGGGKYCQIYLKDACTRCHLKWLVKPAFAQAFHLLFWKKDLTFLTLGTIMETSSDLPFRSFSF
jgi:hypothetical protein